MEFMHVLGTPGRSDRVMILSIFVDDNLLNAPNDNAAELKQRYANQACDHNGRMATDAFFDAGFDLLNPHPVMITDQNKTDFNVPFQAQRMLTMPYGIRTSSRIVARSPTDQQILTEYPCPYMLAPRSSITRTPLRMANSHGVMDAGYRGEVMAKFDINDPAAAATTATPENGQAPQPNQLPLLALETYTRLVQVVAPNMVPVWVRIVDSMAELDGGVATARGEGGFGSTGIASTPRQRDRDS